MAPNSEVVATRNNSGKLEKPRRLSMEGLQRAMSNLSFELSKETVMDTKLPPISEVSDAKCECCGMSEECTPDYIRRVRDNFCGKWVCGLCSEAVKEEVAKNGGRKEAALDAHMSACSRFNRLGRTHPVLFQAEAMREILRKCSRLEEGEVKAKSISPRERNGGVVGKGAIARSSSCIPAIMKEVKEPRMPVTRS